MVGITARRIILSGLLFLASCRANANSPNTMVQRPAVEASKQIPTSQPADYVVEPGDTLDLKFFYQPELNDTLVVRPDGKISPQLIDELPAAGMTVADLKKELTRKYAGTLKQPVVGVSVKELAEQRIFVGGEVNMPGVLPLRGKLTAIQAVMQAGGMKSTAESRQVVILRNQGTDRPLFVKLNLDRDLNTGDATHDLALRPMDIVFVPKTTIARLDDFTDQYIDKLIDGSRSVGVFYNLDGGSVK
jgi:protein involved in polysaccharide export with SLBB domain